MGKSQIESLAQNPNLFGLFKDLNLKGQISNQNRKSSPQISNLVLQFKSQNLKNYTISMCSQTFKKNCLTVSNIARFLLQGTSNEL